ncbi:hypothetical protein B0H17DRAFT_1128195 [Mycena rosella]|uniref:Uncharacterized protein n=1 Tax=Mycena rosella TaxID=1033263 RepID=A0AAD7GQY8_MYCRO|nr:hypothetical protein B0H17DRAFT_1128195 [Mycena rosella]
MDPASDIPVSLPASDPGNASHRGRRGRRSPSRSCGRCRGIDTSSIRAIIAASQDFARPERIVCFCFPRSSGSAAFDGVTDFQLPGVRRFCFNLEIYAIWETGYPYSILGWIFTAGNVFENVILSCPSAWLQSKVAAIFDGNFWQDSHGSPELHDSNGHWEPIVTTNFQGAAQDGGGGGLRNLPPPYAHLEKGWWCRCSAVAAPHKFRDGGADARQLPLHIKTQLLSGGSLVVRLLPLSLAESVTG